MRSAHNTEVIVSALDTRHNHTANDLFPETLPPVVPALWPQQGTRAHEALTALIKAPQNQADYWPGWRLAAYVQSLEYDGWRFITRWIKRAGCRALIKEYELDRTDPATAAALEGGGVAYVQ